MYDIHTHIMPGVDDGAASMTETLQMLQLAADGGTRGVILTPHCNIPGLYRNYYDEFFVQFVQGLRQLLQKKNIPVRVYLGQEVFLTGPFLRLLRQGKLITLNRSVYMLCEFDPAERAGEALRRLQALRSVGCVPIVAHPERYRFTAESPETLGQMKALGALLQVNKDSLKGAFGEDAAHVAHFLLEGRLADFVASDAHSPYSRTPFLGHVHETISELYSLDYANFLLHENPVRVLRNQRIHSF